MYIGKVVMGISVLNWCCYWVFSDNGDGFGMIFMIGSKFYDFEGRVGISGDKLGNMYELRLMI